MVGRGTDALSEGLKPLPAPLRWLVQGTVKVISLVRYLMVVQLLAGAVGAVVGVAQWDRELVAVGLLQMVLASLLLGIGAMGSGDVHEVSGPKGDFVVRGGKRRVWRERRGAGRVLAFVRGTSDWAVVVRRRHDDPFGEPVLIADARTEIESTRSAAEVARQVRAGDLP